MNFGHFSYLVYMLIFTLTPTAILWSINYKFLKKNLKVILLTVLLAVVYQIIVDPIAESWKAWFFSPDLILGIWIINFPIENTIFFALTSLATSSAVLTFLHFQGRFKKGLVIRKS